jgi:hypothetical protein
VEEGIVDYENCVECHRSSDEEEAKQRMQSQGLGSRDGGPGVYRSESKKGRQGKKDDE